MPTDGEGVINGSTLCRDCYVDFLSVNSLQEHVREVHRRRQLQAEADLKPTHTINFKKKDVNKGMGSASGSSCSRRSQRLLGIPALDVPLPIKPREPRKVRKYHKVSQPMIRRSIPPKRTGIYRKRTIAEIMRSDLLDTVTSFLSCRDSRGVYPYGDVVKTCIYPADIVRVHSVKNTPAGFTWVAVHGVDTTWAVFKKDEDAARRTYRNPGCAGAFYYEIGSIAISEMEDIADKNPTSTPLAVVCVNSGTANALKISSEQAVDFVQYKTRSGFPSTDTDNIQIAIGALQLAWQQKFKASDIWVSVFHPMKRTSLLTSQIKDHLSNINTPDSGFYTKEDWAWMNRSGRGGCMEEHLADISGPVGEALTEEHSPSNGGYVEDHLADINEPDHWRHR